MRVEEWPHHERLRGKGLYVRCLHDRLERISNELSRITERQPRPLILSRHHTSDRSTALEHDKLFAAAGNQVEQVQAPGLEVRRIDSHITSVHDHCTVASTALLHVVCRELSWHNGAEIEGAVASA